MINKKYDFDISIEGCNNFIQALNNFKTAFNVFEDKYVYDCLEWIRKRSLEYLESDDTFIPSFTVQDIYEGTTLIVSKGKGKLSYKGDEVLFAEFGTGIVGKLNTKHPLANEGPQWNYASGDYSSSENGFWTWRIPEKYQMGNNSKYITFKGYTGKKFIYYAFLDFINNNIYQILYENFIKGLFDKYF